MTDWSMQNAGQRWWRHWDCFLHDIHLHDSLQLQEVGASGFHSFVVSLQVPGTWCWGEDGRTYNQRSISVRPIQYGVWVIKGNFIQSSRGVNPFILMSLAAGGTCSTLIPTMWSTTSSRRLGRTGPGWNCTWTQRTWNHFFSTFKIPTEIAIFS